MGSRKNLLLDDPDLWHCKSCVDTNNIFIDKNEAKQLFSFTIKSIGKITEQSSHKDSTDVVARFQGTSSNAVVRTKMIGSMFEEIAKIETQFGLVPILAPNEQTRDMLHFNELVVGLIIFCSTWLVINFICEFFPSLTDWNIFTSPVTSFDKKSLEKRFTNVSIISLNNAVLTPVIVRFDSSVEMGENDDNLMHSQYSVGSPETSSSYSQSPVEALSELKHRPDSVIPCTPVAYYSTIEEDISFYAELALSIGSTADADNDSMEDGVNDYTCIAKECDREEAGSALKFITAMEIKEDELTQQRMHMCQLATALDELKLQLLEAQDLYHSKSNEYSEQQMLLAEQEQLYGELKLKCCEQNNSINALQERINELLLQCQHVAEEKWDQEEHTANYARTVSSLQLELVSMQQSMEVLEQQLEGKLALLADLASEKAMAEASVAQLQEEVTLRDNELYRLHHELQAMEEAHAMELQRERGTIALLEAKEHSFVMKLCEMRAVQESNEARYAEMKIYESSLVKKQSEQLIANSLLQRKVEQHGMRLEQMMKENATLVVERDECKILLQTAYYERNTLQTITDEQQLKLDELHTLLNRTQAEQEEAKLNQKHNEKLVLFEQYEETVRQLQQLKEVYGMQQEDMRQTLVRHYVKCQEYELKIVDLTQQLETLANTLNNMLLQSWKK